MKSLVTRWPQPLCLARTFFLPFVVIIGGYGLFLAGLYLLLGLDPVPYVLRFVVGSVGEVLPLAGHLFAVWVAYWLIYLILGGWLGSLATSEEISTWLLAVPSRLHLRDVWRDVLACLIPFSTGTRGLLQFKRVPHLHWGWTPGFSNQLE